MDFYKMASVINIVQCIWGLTTEDNTVDKKKNIIF